MSSEADKLNEQLQRFLDDRDSLGEDELAGMVDALRSSPERLQQLKDQLQIDNSLRRQLDEGDFLRRVRDASRAESAASGMASSDAGSKDADIKQLLQRFVDDRDSLDDQQLHRLVSAVGTSPEQLERLKDQLILDDMLAQLIAVDRTDFPAQLAQRLRDLDRNEDDLMQQVNDMRALAAEEYKPKQTRRRWMGWVMAASVLCAAGLGAWYVLPGLNDRPQVTRVYGRATLIRNEAKTPLLAGEQLSYGDRILVQPNAFAVLSYPDGTEVNLTSQSLIEINSRFRSGKILGVNRGSVSSSVARQPNGRPMRFLTPRADAKVVGTELMLEVSGDATRLNVKEGAVELRGLSNSAPVIVKRRQFAVSDGGKANVQSLIWPSSRQRLEVLIDPVDEQLPVGFEIRGDTRWEDYLRFREGALVAPTDVAQDLTQACKQSGELTIEMLLRCELNQGKGLARIVTLSSDAFTRNFTIGQEQNHLILRLRTQSTGENGNNPQVKLCQIADRDLHHLVVTYRKNRVACYWDGQRVLYSDQVAGDFKTWSEHYLVLGDEWAGGDRSHTWRGQIHALAIYSRALAASEALRNSAAIHAE